MAQGRFVSYLRVSAARQRESGLGQRVNVDFSSPMLEELDREAGALNISRQAVIKTMIRDSLDLRYLAKQAQGVG